MIVKNLKGKEWLIFLLVVFSGIAQVILDVTIPDFMANLTSILQMDTVVIGDVVREGSLMLGFSLLSLIIGILGAYGAAMISGLIAKRIRNQVFDKVMSFSLFEINSFGTASLITRCTNDVTQIQNVLVIVLVIAFKAPLSALLAFMKIAGKNIFWTITMGLIMLFIMVVSMIVLKRVMPLMTKQQYQTDDLTYFDQEHLRGIQVIQAFNAKLFHQFVFADDVSNLIPEGICDALAVQPLGTKLGGGIGTALAGWLLSLSGYVGGAAQQSASTMNMLHIMYLWMPMLFNLLITLILTRLNVEKANEELRKHK